MLRRTTVTRKRKTMKQTSKGSVELGLQQLKRPGASRRQEARLAIPDGEPDLEALRSVTREWLVPRLVEKFLRMHGVELRHSPITSATSTNRLRPSISELEGSSSSVRRRKKQNTSEGNDEIPSA
jgi:hypothetical protein